MSRSQGLLHTIQRLSRGGVRFLALASTFVTPVASVVTQPVLQTGAGGGITPGLLRVTGVI